MRDIVTIFLTVNVPAGSRDVNNNQFFSQKKY